MIVPAPRDGTMPEIHPTAFVAKTAVVIGDVEIGPDANIWFGAVLRGDYGKIKIGARTSIQEQVVCHVEVGTSTIIGEDCIVGHGAIVHGPGTTGNRSMIGLGSIVMQGHQLGNEVFVGAGALARGAIPDNSLVLGIPGKVVKQTTRDQIANHLAAVRGYVENGRAFKAKGLSHAQS